jgi:hypothetical protein
MARLKHDRYLDDLPQQRARRSESYPKPCGPQEAVEAPNT